MSGRPRAFRKLAVVGAGNMGSGIAQKMATEGFSVVLVDLDDGRVAKGLAGIERTLRQGVERKLFTDEQVGAALGRVQGTSDWSALADVDLVVEAVFEDEAVKRNVLARLDRGCRADAILGTNTSSLSVTDLAAATRRPERVIGLHYFYHPAKNRLVEVVPGASTSDDVTAAAWSLQERMGKTPIASADAPGFVVNRYFVPWLNEAVRLLEEGVADVPSIEAAAKNTFGVGMGPFELMNVTGVPIALHAATTLGQKLGPLYAPAERLRQQVATGEPWKLDGTADASKEEEIAARLLGVVFFVAAALVDEGVGTIEDTDIGARVGLRWPRGPFQMMNRRGVSAAADLVRRVTERWGLAVPAVLHERASAGRPFSFTWVKSEARDGVATLTVNRPDAMNALDEEVVAQLHDAFRRAAADDAVRGIVIAGAGKAFIAGADIRFFVRNIDAGDLDRIVAFTKRGHELLADIDSCPKTVVARLHGVALGGGLELALACDRIVASPRASVSFPETGIGIYPGLGGTQRTPRKIGAGLAKWMIYTGETLSAEQARDVGLVDELVPAEELDAAARRLALGERPAPRPRDPRWEALGRFFDSHSAEELRRGAADTGGDAHLARAVKKVGHKAPVALGLSERLIDASGEGSLEAGLRRELDHLVEIFRTADAYEGLTSLGKRRPNFAGR
jgi:enoyl-CoA hydratase/3-hydroxyacyl-CoA dehydrogenase